MNRSNDDDDYGALHSACKEQQVHKSIDMQSSNSLIGNPNQHNLSERLCLNYKEEKYLYNLMFAQTHMCT